MSGKKPAVYQMLPNYWYGDAIGNHTATIYELLKEWGFETKVFADVIHDLREAESFEKYLEVANDNSYLIYHYSTGSPVNQFVLDHGKNVILIYHNITPAEFFEPFEPEAAKTCREGRELLCKFADKVHAAIGVSEYNASELRALGFKNVHVCPFIIDIEKKQASGKKSFNDDKKNFLYVGRVAPHKGVHDLIKTFFFYKTHIDKNARLVIVGGYDKTGDYYLGLKSLVRALGLTDVVFTGSVSDEELGDYFSSATLFASMSKHEGFGVPWLEAMSFGLPVVSLDEAAASETIGAAGLLVSDFNPAFIAELWHEVAHDEKLRQTVISSGYKRLSELGREKAIEKFESFINANISNIKKVAS